MTSYIINVLFVYVDFFKDLDISIAKENLEKTNKTLKTDIV